MQAASAKSRPNADVIHSIGEALCQSVNRVRAISTDLMSGRRSGVSRADQRLAILHACEPGKLHNRSYLIDARGHAEGVLRNREGIGASEATRAWGLLRDLWEVLPHSRICIRPDSPRGLVLQSTGVIESQGRKGTACSYTANRISSLSRLLPDAEFVRFKQINNDRHRVYIEVVDQNEGLMLSTDITAVNDMLRRMALDLRDEESIHLMNRRSTWCETLGVVQENLVPVLDHLATLVRLGPVDQCRLVERDQA